MVTFQVLSCLYSLQEQCWYLVASCWIWWPLECFWDPSMWSQYQTPPRPPSRRALPFPLRAPQRRNTLRAAWMAPLTYRTASPNQTHFHPFLLLLPGTLKARGDNVLRDPMICLRTLNWSDWFSVVRMQVRPPMMWVSVNPQRQTAQQRSMAAWMGPPSLFPHMPPRWVRWPSKKPKYWISPC